MARPHEAGCNGYLMLNIARFGALGLDMQASASASARPVHQNLTKGLDRGRSVVRDPETGRLRMDSTQPTFSLTPPAFEPFGGPHFLGDDMPAETRAAWIGDPSSVPLAEAADDEQRLDPDGTELDQAIYAALLTP
jgi:hypothetical protein